METQKVCQRETPREDMATSAPPPSFTSSPSHEFSFTISLHPCSSSTPTHIKSNKLPPPTFEIDLSPADDIFFHGHLLPLHISHHAISPRPSDISIEEFNLPIKHINQDQTPKQLSNHHHNESHTDLADARERRNPKSISSLFSLRRWRKESEDVCNKGEEISNKDNKKKRFDISRIWRKYASIIDTLLSFKGEKEKEKEKEKRRNLRRKPYSFSGNLNPRASDGGRKRRSGELSLPTSMRTSPTNSGLLFAGAPTAFSTSDESTMEELHNAIQAAIAHCKSSITIKEEKCNLGLDV